MSNTTPPATLAEIYARRDYWEQRLDRARKRQDAAERTVNQSLGHTSPTKMVQQVAALLEPYFPDLKLHVLGPFGLANTVTIHANNPTVVEGTGRFPKTVGSLSFRPDGSRLWLVDDSRSSGEFPEGSVGALNGFNHPQVEMPETVEELVQLLRASITR